MVDHLEFEAEQVKHASQADSLSSRTVIIDLLAGTVAGITSTFAGYPLDIVKFRLQMAPRDTIS